jgi:nicotinate dehydrogenase subunit B
VTRERDFIGLIAKDEYALVAAMPKLDSCCHWSRPESDDSQSAQDLLTQQRSVDTVIRADAGAFRDDADAGVLTATYTKPLIGHGSIGPSCAIACVAQHNGQSTVDVLTHSQNVFALRDQIARVLQIPADSVRVRHRLGAGCYGHNGADDAAMDAVLLARSVPGEPVRVQWSRKDELTSEPLGSPMRVEIAAKLHGSRISSWRLVTRSGTHIGRPGWNNGVNLLSPAAISEAFAFGTTVDLPAHNGGSKNAVALYDFPQHLTYEFVPTMPFRLSALRSLGAFANVFAIESFMDELAKAAVADPIDFRLAHLSDDRARRVIQRVADLAHWSDPRPSGCGRGLGFARFKNTGTYCAVIVEVLVEEVVELRRMWAVVDAGLAINPAGIIAQIEGGMLQAASWALKEEIPTRGGAVIAEGWRDYPILRFNEVPEISIEVVSASEYDSTGVGEASLGPTAGAIGNAVANALDIRVRDLPFTRDRIIAAMMAEA